MLQVVAKNTRVNMLKSLLLGVFFLFFTGTIMATEEPKYTVIEASEAFELRAYSPKIVAETLVSGSMAKASSAGFRLIADFIFGNNTAASGGNKKISMTTPVTMEPKSEKISMTAPVSMEQAQGQWRVQFVMPSEYTLDSLPKPNNPAVTVREVPASNYAVIRFSGLADEAKTAAKTADLLAWLDGRGVTLIGKPELARYNPPWTLPFLRRNEVMVEY
jgi:effector-binding domain-containing protein